MSLTVERICKALNDKGLVAINAKSCIYGRDFFIVRMGLGGVHVRFGHNSPSVCEDMIHRAADALTQFTNSLVTRNKFLLVYRTK